MAYSAIPRLVAPVLVVGGIVAIRADAQSPSAVHSQIQPSSIVSLVKEVKASGAPVVTVTARGRWRQTTKSEFVRLPVVNSVELTCSRQLGTCLEALALLHTPLDSDFAWLWGKDVHLRPRTFSYEIVEWTNERVHARCRAPVADIEILVWPKRQMAERTFRETPDSKGSDPLLLHWILE